MLPLHFSAQTDALVGGKRFHLVITFFFMVAWHSSDSHRSLTLQHTTQDWLKWLQSFLAIVSSLHLTPESLSQPQAVSKARDMQEETIVHCLFDVYSITCCHKPSSLPLLCGSMQFTQNVAEGTLSLMQSMVCCHLRV